MPKIVLLKPHTHAGVKYDVGDSLDLREGHVERLTSGDDPVARRARKKAIRIGLRKPENAVEEESQDGTE